MRSLMIPSFFAIYYANPPMEQIHTPKIVSPPFAFVGGTGCGGFGLVLCLKLGALYICIGVSDAELKALSLVY